MRPRSRSQHAASLSVHNGGGGRRASGTGRDRAPRHGGAASPLRRLAVADVTAGVFEPSVGVAGMS